MKFKHFYLNFLISSSSSRTFENYNENHIRTPQLIASSKNFMRSSESMQAGGQRNAPPDPRQDLTLFMNSSINGVPMNNPMFSFAQPVLPSEIQNLIPQSSGNQQFQVQVREVHYNISFCGQNGMTSFIQPNGAVNNSFFPGHFNASTFPGNNTMINFQSTSNSTLLPAPLPNEVPPHKPKKAKKKKHPMLALPPPSPVKVKSSREIKEASPEKKQKTIKDKKPEPPIISPKAVAKTAVNKSEKLEKPRKEPKPEQKKLPENPHHSSSDEASFDFEKYRKNKDSREVPIGLKNVEEFEKYLKEIKITVKKLKDIDVECAGGSNAKQDLKQEAKNEPMPKSRPKESRKEHLTERETLHDRPLRLDVEITKVHASSLPPPKKSQKVKPQKGKEVSLLNTSHSDTELNKKKKTKSRKRKQPTRRVVSSSSEDDVFEALVKQQQKMRAAQEKNQPPKPAEVKKEEPKKVIKFDISDSVTDSDDEIFMLAVQRAKLKKQNENAP
jgi:hypothetical protein